METREDNNDRGDSSSSTAKHVKVLLPGKEYVLHRWKAKAGASVRAGEIIAYATLPQNNSGVSAATHPEPAVSTTTHKRPKKRKRGVTTPVSAAPAPATASSPSDTASTSTAAAAEKPKKDEAKATNTAAENKIVPIVAPKDGLLRILKNDTTGESLEIGWLEECSHPAIMGGLCAVCGEQAKSSSTDTDSIPSHEEPKQKQQQQQRQVTVSGGITMIVSEKEAQEMAADASRKLLQQGKLALVLDLDHTLVHATADPNAKAHLSQESVRTLLLPFLEISHPSHPQHHVQVQHYVKLRPYVKDFLGKALEQYEVSVYTAGTRLYAQQVTMILCRHMVGASMDQPDLDRLRHEHYMAKQQLQHEERQGEAKKPPEKTELKNATATNSSTKEENKKKRLKTEGGKGDDDASKPPQNSAQTDGEHDKKNAQKKPEEQGLDDTGSADNSGKRDDTASKEPRKKVSFGAPPASLKTDVSALKPANVAKAQEITPDYVDSLSRQLQEAERLEANAMELRQRLFGSRIVSRTDVGDLGRDVKSLKRIFPCGGTMTAIVDDREDVWAKAEADDPTAKGRPGEPPENLLLVKPYHWKPFLGFADVNNASGRIELGNGAGNEQDAKQQGSSSEEKETDVQLLWTSDILDRLHKRFYAMKEGSRDRMVPHILRAMRQEVLAGKRLVLSGLVPLHKQQRYGDGVSPRPTVVRYAEILGATIFDTVRPDTTHVVAARDGTDKTIQARKVPGCVVVKALWLTECLWSLTLRDVTPHLLGLPNRSLPIAASGTAQSRMQYSSSSSDSSDDDLAAEIENELMDSM